MSEVRTRSEDGPGLDRRGFLGAAGRAALLALGAGAARPLLALSEEGDEILRKRSKAAWVEEPKGPYAPFRMAIQSYTFRKFDFEKTVETCFDLRINYMEISSGHIPSDAGEMELKRSLKIMRQNMVRKIAYGVVNFTADHQKNRELFEFGTKILAYALTAYPSPDSLGSLDKLVEEYKLPVAIHNHGPEDPNYRTPEMIEKALAGHHKHIGLCIDTGHFLRADVNPVDVVKRFKDRIFAVHLKDVKTEGGKKTHVVLGQGDLDLVGFLRELKAAGFKGGLALEYEEEENDPTASVKKCLEAVQAAVKKLG